MAGRTPDPNYHGRKLLRELKGLREQAGLTQAEAGERARIDFRKLSRIEQRQLPTYHELVMLLDIYGVLSCDYAAYQELWEQARVRGWWTAYGLRDSRYVRMEDEAQEKREFQLATLPSLLQTEEYARAVFGNSGKQYSKTVMQSLVDVRMRQQERLFVKQALKLNALVYESVLWQGVDRGQARKIIKLAEMPNVTVRIVPQSIKVNAASCGSMVMLSFAERCEPDIAFTETILGLTESQNAGKISVVKCALGKLTSLALSPADTIERLQSLI